MNDPTTGAYASANSPDDSSKAKQVAAQGTQAAGQAAADVKDTAADQAKRVAAETKTQVRSVAGDVRDKLGEQAHSQNDRLVAGIRQTADQLDEMRGERSGSPAATVVSRVADGGRQFADYLDRNGPEGVLREVQDFARRRPGAFLATALAAGFVVGRLGKSVAKADSTAGKPSTDSFTSTPTTTTPAYATPSTPPVVDYTTSTTSFPETGTYAETGTYPETGTEYAATGTGTPVVVDEGYTTGREPLA